MRTESLLLALLPAALASPTVSKRAPSYKLSQSFSLLARVTKQPSTGKLPIDKYVVSSAHFAAGEDFAVLVPNTTASAARTFYQNGTTDQLIYGDSTIQTEGGSPPFPFGWVMAPNTSSTTGTLDIAEINGGSGTPGVRFAGVEYTGPGSPDDNPYLAYYNTTSKGSGSHFIACPTILYGHYLNYIISWRNTAGTTPKDCAEIVLLPQCAGKWDNGTTKGLQQSPCYADASKINPATLRPQP